MITPRISASSYSNTAPLIWSFLYGRNHGRVELILDNAPARSAELLSQERVDAALVPVIAYQEIDTAKLIDDVCVGAKHEVRSVCLVTRGADLNEVSSVALDVSSRTSAVLVQIIFREFLGTDPTCHPAQPNVMSMLQNADAALVIGDPALSLASNPNSGLRTFDLAALWHQHTGLGFIFAMWMTRREQIDIDFAAARDEGMEHTDEIAGNYDAEIGLRLDEMKRYLTENISYAPDESMKRGMELYFKLAEKNGLIAQNKPLSFI